MSPEDRSKRDPLQSLIAEILDTENRGEAVDRDSLLAEHPDHADSLREFFASHDQMKSAANVDPPTLPPRSSGPESEDPTIAPGATPLDDSTLLPTEPGGDDPTLPPTEGTSQKGESTVGDKVRYFGDYELLEEIARGGMGVVYKARQMNLNRIVALKMILSGQFAGEEDVQRFYTEAEAAASLDHPGIVPIFEIGEHAGQHYFSMGYIEGKNLAQRVVDGPLPPREAAELVKKICDAMAYAHERGVIHRDLKPANILIDSNGQPKVTDFGLAKKTEADSGLTGTGQILGTPAYMPPEQASGKMEEIGPLADVYSLGAVLYCLLTGRPPFEAASPMDTLLQVLEKEPVAPSQLNPSVPRDLETICLKCLQKEPQRRYVAAEALSQDLQRYLNGEPIVARPISRVERAWRWCQRKPVAAGLMATAVLLLLTLGIGGPYIAVQQAEFAKRQVELRREADEARVDAETRRRESDEAKSVAVAARQHEAEQRQKAEMATRNAELAQANESEARKVAEAERDAKGIALTRAEGLALCAQSNAVRESHPSLALLLAIESVQRTPTRVTFANLYAARMACRETRTLVGHEDEVRDAAFSHDGRLVATASADRSFRVWDAASGKVILDWRNYVPPVRSVALSPDGKRVAATTEGAVLFKAKSGTAIANLFQRLVGGSNNNSGKQFLYTDRICRVWDTGTSKELFRLTTHEDRVTSIEFTADGKHVVTSSWDQTVRLWDADTAEELKVWRGFDGRPLASISCSNDGRFIVAIPENEPERSDHPFHLVKDPNAIDPDAPLVGGDVVAAYFHDSNLDVPQVERPAVAFLINVEQDKIEPLRRSNTELRPTDCAIGFDGKQVAVAFQQGLVEVWSVNDLEKPTTRLSGHHGPVNAVALSDDGKLVATGGDDRSVRIWDAETGKQKAVFRGHSSPVRSVDFGPGDRIVSSGDQTARVWDLQPVKPMARTITGHTARVVSVEFSPDGNRIVTASEDGKVRVCDTSSDKTIFLLDKQKLRAKPVFARFSPDGKHLITSVDERDPIRVWDAQTGAELLSFKDDRGAAAAFYSSDAKFVVTVSDEHVRTARDWTVYTNAGHICIWDSESAKRLVSFPIPSRGDFIPTISPDSRWIVGAHREESGTAHVFDMASGNHLLSLNGHRNSIRDIAINPRGDQILTGSDDDTVCLWDAKTGDCIARLEGFGGDVTLCEYSADGSQFVTVVNSIAYVWDTQTLELVATLNGHESLITKAQFTPDGSHLFTLSEDQTAAFWEIESSRMMLLFQAAIDEVIDADINSSGTLVATGSSDGSVRLWPVDIWPSINDRLPRQLTPEERQRYDLVTWQERLLKQSQSIPHARQEQP